MFVLFQILLLNFFFVFSTTVFYAHCTSKIWTTARLTKVCIQFLKSTIYINFLIILTHVILVRIFRKLGCKSFYLLQRRIIFHSESTFLLIFVFLCVQCHESFLRFDLSICEQSLALLRSVTLDIYLNDKLPAQFSMLQDGKISDVTLDWN